MGATRPFFTYYGGKWRTAKRYPAPIHGTIIEPFAGSAGYSLRYVERNVILIDSYEPVAALWAWLIQASQQDVLDIPDIAPGEDVGAMGLDRGPELLVSWWLNKGNSRPCNVMSAWAREGRYSRQFWGEVVRNRIASQVHRIDHWQVIHGDYRDAPDIEATWFVDPPYVSAAGRHYIHNDIDYHALREWCSSRRGQAMVCEQYGAEWCPFLPMAPAKGRRRMSREVLWHRGSR